MNDLVEIRYRISPCHYTSDYEFHANRYSYSCVLLTNLVKFCPYFLICYSIGDKFDLREFARETVRHFKFFEKGSREVRSSVTGFNEIAFKRVT